MAIAALLAALSGCGGENKSSGNPDNVAPPTVATSTVSSEGVSLGTSETGTSVDTTNTVDLPSVRPPLSTYGSVPMAFDQQSGVVVAMFPTDRGLTEAWTFDVTTRTWTKRSTSDMLYKSRIVYDPMADLTIAVTKIDGFAYSFDVNTDKWSQLPVVPPNTIGGGRAIVALAYDQQNAQTVALNETAPPPDMLTALAFTPDIGTWTGIALDLDPQPLDRIPLLMTYASSIDRFVLVTGDDIWRTNGSPSHATWTLDPDTGTWDKVDTAMPELNFGFDTASGTEITYVPTTDRVIVYTGGVVAEYDPVAQTWQTFNAVQTSTDTDAAFGLNRHAATLVYDPVNDQVLMYGGTATRLNWTTPDDMWATTDDMWAYEPDSHTWSMLLDATQTS